MKVNIEIECTPEEARNFMGLPDVGRANSIYMDSVVKAMQAASNPAQLREYAESLAPMGQIGLELFQSFVEAGMRGAGANAGAAGRDRDAPGKAAAEDGN